MEREVPLGATKRLHHQLPPQQHSQDSTVVTQGPGKSHLDPHLAQRKTGGRREGSLWVPKEAVLQHLEAGGKGVHQGPERPPIGVELKSGVPDHTPEKRPP